MPQKLFVGNLPHEVTDSELGEFVSGAGFQAASAVVIRDKVTGQSRGFGFIELAEGEDMERAIAGLNGQSLQGRRLTVNEARPPRNDFGGGGGIVVLVAVAAEGVAAEIPAAAVVVAGVAGGAATGNIAEARLSTDILKSSAIENRKPKFHNYSEPTKRR